MNKVPIKDLQPGCFFTSSVYADGKYILLAPETPLTRSLLNHLIEWEFRELHTDGTVVEEAGESETEREAPTEELKQNPEPSSALEGDDDLAPMRHYYDQFTIYIESVYNTYVTKNEFKAGELSDHVKILVDTITENRRLLLRVLSAPSTSKNYLVAHTVRSTILAVVLGSFLKVQPHRLIELGVAAILHEIGMVRLPPQLYMADRQLSVQEKKSIMAHPIIGYNLLKEGKFPLPVCLAALEHHERMNGSGYPRALPGEKISLYARIIAVACSYDAVTAARPYKEAKDGYAGMVDILKNEGKQYDDAVIKALVYSLSIYPIGSYVLLTSGKKAQVVDVNANNPRFPVVQILGSKTPDGKNVVVATSDLGVRILRPLASSEIG